MKFLFSLLCLLLTLSALPAQDLVLGPETKGKRNEIIQDIIHHDETGFYALRQAVNPMRGNAPIIEKYSSKMVQIYQTKLKEFTSPLFKDEGYFVFKNRLFIAGSRKRPKQKETDYFFREIDKKTGQMTGNHTDVGTEMMEKRTNIPELFHRISQDDSKLALFLNDAKPRLFRLPGTRNKKLNYSKFTLKVFDDNLQEQWTQRVVLPYDDSRLSVLRFDVDNQGNIYLLATYRPENWRDLKRSKKPYFSYKILAYRQGGDKVDEYDVTLRDKYISDITFDINKNDDLTCSGFFSDKFYGSLAGTFIFTIDAKTKKITREDTREFDTSELSLFMSERRARKGKEISANFDLEDFVLRSDGGAVLIGESFYISEVSTTDGNGRTSTTRYYNYGPLIIVNVNPNGKIAWVTKIDKRQRSQTTAFSSYAMAIVKSKIYFVFNQSIRRRSNVIVASVNADGKVSEKEMYRVKDEKMRIRTPGCEQISDREMIVYGEWKKKFRFGKLTF